jgi:hypothetical protein
MPQRLRVPLLVLAALLMTAGTASGLTGAGNSVLVNTGTSNPATEFAQNKQNEPQIAINPIQTDILAAGSNDEIDLELCRAATLTGPTDCPFTDGVGVTGVYFSTNSGSSWTQPQYTGYTARTCVTTAPCQSTIGTGAPADASHAGVGPIGTLPLYYESGLVSDGDPAMVWGPFYDPSLTTGFGLGRHFTWAKQRLYYANLTSNLSATREEQTFKGAEAIAVSRLDSDKLASAIAGNNNAWYRPVIVSRQSSALFSDKEEIWADNVQTSPFFGNVYVCNVAFRSNGLGGAPEPAMFVRSTDGGQTWNNQKQLSAATNTNQTGGRQGCAVRTDSAGTVYVFWVGTDIQTRGTVFFMTRSFNGGVNFERPRVVANVTPVGLFDPATGRFSFDGIAGARTDSFPSVDIANGAPYGVGPTDEIVMTWSEGPTTTTGNTEKAPVRYSLDRGVTWAQVDDASSNAAPDDRPDFPAIAISPDGTDVYLTYTNFLEPWKTNTIGAANDRPAQGVVRHADVGAGGTPGAFADLFRGPTGDARGTSQNGLTAEFLGDYNYAFATNDYGAAIWNDTRNAADCGPIDAWRASILGIGPAAPRPAPNSDCPDAFGNSDIYAGTYADPTP